MSMTITQVAPSLPAPFRLSLTSRQTRILGSTAFVGMWTSGFIIGRLATDQASAMALTFWRFSLAAVVATALALAFSAKWPRTRPALRNVAVTGLLIQAVQFSGVYLGLGQGMPAGLSALIVGTSPLVGSVAGGPILGEHLTRVQWLGSA